MRWSVRSRGSTPPSSHAQIGAGDPIAVIDLLERIRAEDPDEPLWQGVERIEPDGDHVSVHFHEGVDPALRPAGGVEVACVLYGETPEGSVTSG